MDLSTPFICQSLNAFDVRLNLGTRLNQNHPNYLNDLGLPSSIPSLPPQMSIEPGFHKVTSVAAGCKTVGTRATELICILVTGEKKYCNALIGADKFLSNLAISELIEEFDVNDLVDFFASLGDPCLCGGKRVRGAAR